MSPVLLPVAPVPASVSRVLPPTDFPVPLRPIPAAGSNQSVSRPPPAPLVSKTAERTSSCAFAAVPFSRMVRDCPAAPALPRVLLRPARPYLLRPLQRPAAQTAEKAIPVFQAVPLPALAQPVPAVQTMLLQFAKSLHRLMC